MAACKICSKTICGCGGQTLCGVCRARIKAVENNQDLSQEEKNQKIAEIYANNNPT